MVLVLLPVFAFGGEVSVRLASGVKMDDAGRALREALDRLETGSGLPSAWTSVRLTRGESHQLANNTFLVLSEDANNRPQLLFVDGSELHRETLREGEEVRLGRLQVIMTLAIHNGAQADLLVRAEPVVEDDVEGEKRTSPTEITGLVNERELRIKSPDRAALDFSATFLRQLNYGKSPAEAERLAHGELVAPKAAAAGAYTDATNVLEGRAEKFQPLAARVTLRLVRGESSAIRELCTSWQYRNTGRGNSDPPVSLRGGGRGADISVGARGDRFQYRLRALEAQGSVKVENETLVRVPLGGHSSLNLNGPRGYMEAWVHATPRGQEHVELLIDHLSGDWNFLGSMSTRVRMRDGQTTALAQNTYQRSSSSSSGPPIISGIPYIGPAFGNERRVVESSTYALLATMELE